jgi:hypothetical protein
MAPGKAQTSLNARLAALAAVCGEVRRGSWWICALRRRLSAGLATRREDRTSGPPLPKSDKPLHNDAAVGMRVR